MGGGKLILQARSALIAPDTLLMVTGPAMSLEASPQPLPVSVRMSGVGGARSRFHSFAHLPATAVGTSVLFGVLSFLYQALLVWGTRASTS